MVISYDDTNMLVVSYINASVAKWYPCCICILLPDHIPICQHMNQCALTSKKIINILSPDTRANLFNCDLIYIEIYHISNAMHFLIRWKLSHKTFRTTTSTVELHTNRTHGITMEISSNLNASELPLFTCQIICVSLAKMLGNIYTFSMHRQLIPIVEWRCSV